MTHVFGGRAGVLGASAADQSPSKSGDWAIQFAAPTTEAEATAAVARLNTNTAEHSTARRLRFKRARSTARRRTSCVSPACPKLEPRRYARASRGATARCPKAPHPRRRPLRSSRWLVLASGRRVGNCAAPRTPARALRWGLRGVQVSRGFSVWARTSPRPNHKKFVKSPELVQLIGKRFAAGQTLRKPRRSGSGRCRQRARGARDFRRAGRDGGKGSSSAT